MSTILVIDDEKSVLDAVQLLLHIFGHKVQVAVDGKDGIEKFEKNLFDLVITDINMPQIDGYGVARYIRTSRRPATPIIAITGALRQIDGKRAAFDKILEKPFPLQSLADMVRDLTPLKEA